MRVNDNQWLNCHGDLAQVSDMVACLREQRENNGYGSNARARFLGNTASVRSFFFFLVVLCIVFVCVLFCLM